MKHWLLRIVHIVAALACIGCSLVAHGQLAKVSASVTANNQPLSFDLSTVPGFDISQLTIENIGNSSVVMPELDGNGDAPVVNPTAIVEWLHNQSDGTDRSLAEAAWRYVTNHMTAYCLSGSQYDGPYAAGSPWVILRGYGFGCCTQSAVVLAWLWHQVGLESRAAWWTGHAVAEVYYDNDWHEYDPDHRVYYTTDDGTVANVAMVVANPALVASGAGSDGLDPVGWSIERMEALYTGAMVNYGEYDPWFAAPTYGLDPGETLYLNSENIIASVVYRTLAGAWGIGPSAVSSGTLVHSVDFGDSQWRSKIFSVVGMNVVTDQLGTALRNTSANGSVILQKTWYSPAFDLQLDGGFYRDSSSDVISVYFSTDGVNWSPRYAITPPPGSFQPMSINLTPQAVGAYSIYVMIQVSGNPGDVGISSLKLATNFQAGKPTFPRLIPGAPNQLIYRDASPDGQGRSLRVTLVVNNDQPVALGMQLPKIQDQTLPLQATVSDLEAYLRGPLIFYPWLSYGDPTASSTLWQEQQGGSVLQAVATSASDYLVTGVDLSWERNPDGPTTWALAKRNPVSLNFDWLKTPLVTDWFGAMMLPISSPGDQFIVSTSQGATTQLLGRTAYQGLTTTSLIPEDPLYSIARGYSARHLTDGSPRTLAYPGATHFDYQVDLGSLVHVNAVGLVWGYFGANPIYIQTWILYGRKRQTDSWQVLAQGGFPGAETTTVDLDFDASQLRIAATSSNWIGMFELSVAATTPLTLSATSNVAEMTTLSSFGPAAHLVDGNENTLAYPGSYYNDYTMDPNGQAFIDQVRIVWGYFGTDPNYVSSWRLYGQKQVGTTWEVISRGGFPNAAASVVSVRNAYRRLRIAADGVNWPGIYEVEIYGKLLN